MVQIKRAYSQPIPNDGVRTFVDRVWPRGHRTEHLQLMKRSRPEHRTRNGSPRSPEVGRVSAFAIGRELQQPELGSAIDELAKLARIEDHAGVPARRIRHRIRR